MAEKVGLVLALDGEKQFSKDLRDASETVKLAKQALSSVNDKYYGTANSMTALTERAKALSTVQDTLNRKIQAASAGQAKANENYNKISTELEKVRTKLKYAATAIESTEAVFGKMSPEAEAARKALEKLEQAEADLAHQQDREEKSMLKWQTAVNKATGELRKCEAEISDVDRYIEEAGQSADGCATSIDGFGRKVKKAGDEADKAKDDVKSFGEMIGERLSAQMLKQKAFDMVCDGLRRIGQAAVDATKQMVKTGMEFNAQMSRVGAITNASSSDMKILTDKAMQLGRKTVYTATESASAMEQLSLAGWRTESIISGIDGVLALASSSSMDLATAATYVSDNLNAYGLSADKAAELSDVMAYAMSNSSQTTTDLGEAYGKVAATAAAYGYSYKEVTAVLMTMANAGRKGGEAGTSLNTIMTRLSTNTSHCAEAIADYNGGVDIVYDSAGKMRPLTDVLTDLHDVWVDLDDAERNALAKQIAGVRQGNALYAVMAGMDEVVGGTARSFSDYATELENCEGAAQRMADISLDNLAGDVELMNDAIDGLAITIEGKFDRGIRTFVQSITGVINGITDAITGEKSELDQFVEDIRESNEEVGKLLDRSAGTMNQADMDISDLEHYKEVLIDLNSQEDITEFQKYQLKSAVQALAKSVPGLAAAFDEESGKLKLTNKEITDMIDNAENLALRQALISAQADSMDALAQATLDELRANSALYNALDKQNAVFGTNYDSAQDLLEAVRNGEVEYNYMKVSVDQLLDSFMDAYQAQTDATSQAEEARKQIEEEDAAFAELKEEMGLTSNSIDEMKKSGEGLSEEIEGTTQAVNENTEAFEESAEEIAKAAEEEAKAVIEAYDKMREGIASSIRSSISLEKEWEQGDSIGAHKMVENLESQIKGVEKWQDNMVKLAKATGDGFSQNLYDKLVEMGPEGANLVQDIVDAMESGSEDFDRLSELWEKSLDLENNGDSLIIAHATQAGRDLAKAQTDGIVEGFQEAPSELTSAFDKVLKLASTGASSSSSSAFKTAATTLVSAFSTSMSGSSEPESAGKTAASNAAGGAGSGTGSFVGKGLDAAAGYAQGIANGSNMAVNAAADMARRAIDAAAKAQKSNSPSKEFAKKGKDAASGYALGISKNSSSSAKAAANMAKKAIKAANDALRDAGFSKKEADSMSKKISNAFGVSWYTGSGKKKKKKDVETYYSDVYRAAKKFADNKEVLNDWSLRQEEAYWQRVLLKLKKGTQAWYDAKKQIKKLQDDVIKERASNQSTILDDYKVYNQVSLKAEMEYWDKARKAFKQGTDARIEADKKYLNAKDAYYDQLTSMEEDYQNEYNNITDNLKETVDDLTQTYKDSVEETRESILSSMNTFEEFTAEGFKPKKLLKNLETQVEALELYEETLARLRERGVSQDLMSILQAEGVDGVANAYSISQMTDEELAAYEELLRKKSQIASEHAIRENAFLLADTNRQIEEANKVADDAFKELEQKYTEAIAKIGAEAPEALMKMLAKAGSTPADAIAAMFKNYEAVKSSDNTIEKFTTDISDRLSAIIPASEDVGKMALESFLSAMTDDAVIAEGAHKIVGDLKDALEYEGMNLAIKNAQLSSDIAKVGITGTTMLNDLMAQTTPQTVVNVDNSSVSTVMMQFMQQFSTSLMETLKSMQVVLDSGVAVGELTDQLNTSLGSAYTSGNRGSLR